MLVQRTPLKSENHPPTPGSGRGRGESYRPLYQRNTTAIVGISFPAVVPDTASGTPVRPAEHLQHPSVGDPAHDSGSDDHSSDTDNSSSASSTASDATVMTARY